MEHLPDEIFEQYFLMADSELNLDRVDSQVLYLWNKRISAVLRYAFPSSPSRQPEYIFTRVRYLQVLRNRIAHHDPIHQRDIAPRSTKRVTSLKEQHGHFPARTNE